MHLMEAFKALDALNEDTFSLDNDGIKKLSEFEQNDDLVDEVTVYDKEAEDTEDLKDSYVGKVILDCVVCHSKLYKDKEDVEVNETEDLANVGEECPYCYTSDGFKIIGEVAHFHEDEEDEEDENEDDDDDEDEDDDEEKDESLNESSVATLERPMSKFGGTLSNILIAHKDELSNITTKSEAIDFLHSIEPEVKNKGYLRRVLQQLNKIPEYKVSMFLYNIILKGDGMGVAEDVKTVDNDTTLNESVENIEIKTDSDTINVTAEGNGAVNVSTEPNIPAEGEQIIPVSEETKLEILDDDNDIEENEVDVDLTDFDEDTFNKLGESYLKNIYENVNSFKLSNVAANDTKIKLEGIIKFNSGNEKKTSFIFESGTIDRNNKLTFIGENTNITRGKKAFTLKGQLNEGKFISESFNYNYRAKNSDGKSSRVYGTVRVNEGV